MRIRTIKPEFFTHEGIFEAEKESGLPLRIAFIGLWCVADREGRFRWEPRRLGVQILPYDMIDFSRVLHALSTRGFIRRYASEMEEFGWIPSFPKHQVINNREKESELPDPCDCKEIDACATRAPRVTTRDQSCKGEGKGREGKGREGNMEGKGTRKGDDASPTLPFDSPEFAAAWSDWKQHRKEIKKPITPTSERQQLTTLQAMGEPMAIATIRHTINKGWQGLRQPDGVTAFPATRDGLEPIVKQIMGLRAGWGLPLATNESRAISDRMAIFEALTPEQWETIREYLSARLPEGQPGWQPQGRLKFIESITDVWSYAEQWARKNGKRRIQGNLI